MIEIKHKPGMWPARVWESDTVNEDGKPLWYSRDARGDDHARRREVERNLGWRERVDE